MNCRLGGNGGDLIVEKVWLALDKLQHVPSPNDLFNLEFRVKRGLDELAVEVIHFSQKILFNSSQDLWKGEGRALHPSDWGNWQQNWNSMTKHSPWCFIAWGWGLRGGRLRSHPLCCRGLEKERVPGLIVSDTWLWRGRAGNWHISPAFPLLGSRRFKKKKNVKCPFPSYVSSCEAQRSFPGSLLARFLSRFTGPPANLAL